MSFEIRKATRKQAKLRLGLMGASGSGKTYSALRLGCEFAKLLGTKNPVLIDTEKNRSEIYANEFTFDVIQLGAPYSPERYNEAIHTCEKEGYKVIIIDSISHEWNGTGGILEIWSGLGNRQTDWKELTPRHQRFIETILQSDAHIIATVRSKAEYQAEQNDKGKIYLKKVGTSPQQRDGLDFEMTAMLALNENHYAQSDSDKTHLFDGQSQILDENTAKRIFDWLNSGEPYQEKKEEPKAEPPKEEKQKNKTNWNLQMAVDELKKYMDMYDLPPSAYEALNKEIAEGKLDMKRITVFHDSCDKYDLNAKYMATEEEILLFLNSLTEIEISKNMELLQRVTALEKSMKISKMKLGILKEEAATCPKRAAQEEKEPDFDGIPDIDINDPEKKKGKKDLFNQKLPAGVL
jgi:hypothetical protein